VGIDNICVKTATEKGVFVTNIPTTKEISNAVADLTFSLILAIARKVCKFDKSGKEGKWIKLIGSEVYGKTLGVIGGGFIGSSVIERAAGFNMAVLVYDLRKNDEIVEKYNARYVGLEYLLKNSDFVTIHMPLNDETKDFIGRRELEMMKNSSYIINTARGGIVNEKDLYEALIEGRIAGAALDVFTEEPPESSPLLKLDDNLITTPHIGNYTMDCMTVLDLISSQNVIDVLNGSRPEEKYIVNKELIKKIS
ncbi:MAG: NAD(P)-dependent oxidoreductase, partial [Actinomycetota bacterium]